MAAEQGTPPPSQEPLPPQADEEFLEEEQYEQGAFMTVMASAMPWVISLLFHVGIFLILIFIVMVVLQTKPPETVIVPDAHLSQDPGGRMNPGAVSTKVTTQRKAAKKTFTRKESVMTDASKTDKPLNIIGAAGGASGGSMADVGMSSAGSGAGPRSNFFGSGGNAHNVVYVIDRSGSMIDTFDHVRYEMLKSIGRLQKVQTFHIILFATGKPYELAIEGRKQLQPASDPNKREAARFLGEITAEGQTDPVQALQRAFAVLRGAKLKGKLIYLLTDGLFPDNAKVLQAIQEQNAQKDVFINTFLYGSRPQEAVEVMGRIAEQNGGKYRFVSDEGV